MNKIVFIDTNRKPRARPMPESGPRAFRHARGAVRPARPALTCIWRFDPTAGRLVACWSPEADNDLTHWPRKSPFTKRAAGVAPASRAA
jgi:hypothetical protein